jgi:hypothetical protein
MVISVSLVDIDYINMYTYKRLYIYIYIHIYINKSTCEKCLVAISSFDNWLNNTEEVSIKNNFILIPKSTSIKTFLLVPLAQL